MHITNSYIKIKMKEKEMLLNVKSDDNLKNILSYSDYNTILKLIKYNKKIQNRLEFSIENYKRK